MELLLAAHHPSVFSLPEHVAELTGADGFEKLSESATPLRIRQLTGG